MHQWCGLTEISAEEWNGNINWPVTVKQTSVVNMGWKYFWFCLSQHLMCTIFAVRVCRWMLLVVHFLQKPGMFLCKSTHLQMAWRKKGLFYTEIHNVVSGCHHFQHIWPTQFPVLNQLFISLSPRFSFLMVWLALRAICFNFGVWKRLSLEKNRSPPRRRVCTFFAPNDNVKRVS